MKPTKRNAILAILLLLLVLLPVACSDDPSQVDPTDAGDQISNEEVGSDTDDPEADAENEGPHRVEIDFDESFDPVGEGFVRVAQIKDPADLIDGEVSQALIDDWLLENDHGRYIIGLGNRAVGPCSWDGNPIALEAVDGDERSTSVLGEICFLLNISQTFKPEFAEIIEDGSQGRAILAITGIVAPLDFLNLRIMAADIAPGLLDLVDLDPDRPLPFTITVYYVLTPDDRSLRVVTAVKNHGEEEEFFIGAHLVLSGSTGSYFTPLGGRKGWGYRSLGPNNLRADPVSYLGYFARHSGYTFVPDPVEHMEARLPVGAGMIAISGAAGLVYGTTDILEAITAKRAKWPELPVYIGLDPGQVTTLGYRLYPGDGSISSTTDAIFSDLGVETTTLSGRVVDHEGLPVEGAKVSFLEEGDRAFTMSWTDEDGSFQADVPFGTWEIRARTDGALAHHHGVVATAEELALDDLSLPQPATLNLTVRTPDGEPTPARVIIACTSDCGERRPDSRELDSSFHPPQGRWLRIIEIGVLGDKSISLPPGEYRISVNRGMTWSTWPADAIDSGGALFDLLAGDVIDLQVEIAKVVDDSATLGSDFHIHAMASPDSQVANSARVLDFLAGGLDVMVSSDHDAISDFAPTIEQLGAQDFITSIVGSEITSNNLGHINAFPLVRAENTRRGGTIDWSRGGGSQITLQELIDLVYQYPGEQVVQLNHPRAPGGAIGQLQADVLTGQSFASAESLNMPHVDVDPETGNTGLWTDDFDALEVYNGFNDSNFWSGFRWWLTMVGRGFSPTATAVSDTHGIYGSLGASPRSFVFVDEGLDSPATMNLEHYIDRIKSGALVGTNGPFMRVAVEGDEGQTATIGDTVVASQGMATARVTVELPDWIDVDTLDVFFNIDADDLMGAPGQAITSPVDPTQRIDLSWDAGLHRELVATGETHHYRWRQTIEIPLTITEDSYVVFIAHGINARDMRPVLASSVLPLAFSNPVFIDFDGNGYDNPPLMAEREARLAQGRHQGLQHHRHYPFNLDDDGVLSVEDLARFIEAITCDHDNHGPGPRPSRNHDHHHHHHHGGHSHSH